MIFNIMLGSLIMTVGAIGMGGLLLLAGTLFHYFKDMYHERRTRWR